LVWWNNELKDSDTGLGCDKTRKEKGIKKHSEASGFMPEAHGRTQVQGLTLKNSGAKTAAVLQINLHKKIFQSPIAFT